jgi:hypothetical protein
VLDLLPLHSSSDSRTRNNLANDGIARFHSSAIQQDSVSSSRKTKLSLAGFRTLRSGIWPSAIFGWQPFFVRISTLTANNPFTQSVYCQIHIAYDLSVPEKEFLTSHWNSRRGHKPSVDEK